MRVAARGGVLREGPARRGSMGAPLARAPPAACAHSHAWRRLPVAAAHARLAAPSCCGGCALRVVCPPVGVKLLGA